MPYRLDDDRYHQYWQQTVSSLAEVVNADLKHAVHKKTTSMESWLLHHQQITVDLFKTPLDQKSVAILNEFATNIRLKAKIDQLLHGDNINRTEHRAAHHTALRQNTNIIGGSHAETARQTLDTICKLADHIRSGGWLGASGSAITDVVNIGIGGSDLGPRMVCTALTNEADRHSPNVHFVSNIDPNDLARTLANCHAERTLFIISSKSFGTLETLENAKAAKRWLMTTVAEEQLSHHFVAISSNVEKAIAFGLHEHNVFPMWDWVGGRYSLWSAIGLPIAIALGSEKFLALLEGAQSIDQHFASAPLEKNIPVLLAYLDFIYVNVLNISSIAVLPYSDKLRLLPDYLQQLLMESNGKSVRNNGEPTLGHTSPVYWGSAGTVGQHSFHQLLHQGTHTIACEFVLPLNANAAGNDKRAIHLVANCLAQSKALLEGKSAEVASKELEASTPDLEQRSWLANHKAIPGNRPNIIIAMDELTAKNLGALIALYEHRTFVQSVLWDINAFDQWGVELGKQLSGPIYHALTSNNSLAIDNNTDYWVRHIKSRMFDNRK